MLGDLTFKTGHLEPSALEMVFGRIIKFESCHWDWISVERVVKKKRKRNRDLNDFINQSLGTENQSCEFRDDKWSWRTDGVLLWIEFSTKKNIILLPHWLPLVSGSRYWRNGRQTIGIKEIRKSYFTRNSEKNVFIL